MLLSSSVGAVETREHRAVAAVLMAEAWGEGERGMAAVMEVIQQRALERSRTVYKVITVPKAFSCLNGTTPDKLIEKYRSKPDFATALRLAQMPAARLPGITRRANHYTALPEVPYWARGHKPVAVIGRHAFYRL